MRFTMVIDDALLDEARRVTGTTEVQELVDLALRELVRQEQRQALVASFGTFDLAIEDDGLHRLRRADLKRLALHER